MLFLRQQHGIVPLCEVLSEKRIDRLLDVVEFPASNRIRAVEKSLNPHARSRREIAGVIGLDFMGSVVAQGPGTHERAGSHFLDDCRLHTRHHAVRYYGQLGEERRDLWKPSATVPLS